MISAALEFEDLVTLRTAAGDEAVVSLHGGRLTVHPE